MVPRKKDPKFIIKRDPHLLGERPLDFDNFTEEEIMAKTDKEKAQLFLLKYKRVVKPFTSYPENFKNKQDTNRILSSIKRNYIKFVLNGDWGEKKYVLVINNILANNTFLNEKNIIENGISFDNGNLFNRRKGRRRRL